MMVKFDASLKDHRLIHKIARRYALPRQVDFMAVVMDVTAVHVNGCPLRLQELLEADGRDFFHDVGGIVRNIDRETGQLRDCFLPRYAQR